MKTLFYVFSRFAYPVYLLQNLKDNMGDQQLMLFYDVACSFEAHLKVCWCKSVYVS